MCFWQWFYSDVFLFGRLIPRFEIILAIFCFAMAGVCLFISLLNS